MTKLTVNELFSGIGSQRKALERLGIPHEVVGIAEIDKYSIDSYEAMFGKTRNYGDISKIEKLDYADFWTYSFPCQDISIAGKQGGIKKGTRSGLLKEVQRLLEVASIKGELPKYLMLENVKNLVGKKFKPQYDEWIEWLNELGYNTYWKVMNAKDYGIPQNRGRVIAISIRKDIDKGTFNFPKYFDSGIKLKDLLEKDVDEKYNLSKRITDYFIKHSIESELTGKGFRFKPHNPDKANIAFAITTRAGARMDDNFISLKSIGDGDKFEFTEKNLKNIAEQEFLIRKLTPLECWRVMGFDDSDFDKASAVNSTTQLYKQAGNSIVVNVLCELFEILFKAEIKQMIA